MAVDFPGMAPLESVEEHVGQQTHRFEQLHRQSSLAAPKVPPDLEESEAPLSSN
jgi:hypothetical protein